MPGSGLSKQACKACSGAHGGDGGHNLSAMHTSTRQELSCELLGRRKACRVLVTRLKRPGLFKQQVTADCWSLIVPNCHQRGSQAGEQVTGCRGALQPEGDCWAPWLEGALTRA